MFESESCGSLFEAQTDEATCTATTQPNSVPVRDDLISEWVDPVRRTFHELPAPNVDRRENIASANSTRFVNPEPQHRCEFCGALFDSLSTAADHEAVCRWQQEAHYARGLAERPHMYVFETRTTFLSEAEDRMDNTELAGLNGPFFSSDILYWDLDPKLRNQLSGLYNRFDVDNSGLINDEAELELLAHHLANFAFAEMQMEVRCCHHAFMVKAEAERVNRWAKQRSTNLLR